MEMLVFVAEGNREENPQDKARTNDKLHPHMAPGRNRARVILAGGQHSHYGAIPAPPLAKNSFLQLLSLHLLILIF